MTTAPNAISRILAETQDKMGAFGYNDPTPEQVALKVMDQLLEGLIWEAGFDPSSRAQRWALMILHESNSREGGTAMCGTTAKLTL